LSGLIIPLERMTSGVWSTGDMKIYCQRYNVNVTCLICNHFTEETNTTFYDPTIPWQGIGKGFWRRKRDQVP